MKLFDRLRKNQNLESATAIPAIPAIRDFKRAVTPAQNSRIAKIAVADSSNWNAKDDGASAPFTPYCCRIEPALVQQLHELIAKYAAQYRLADNATQRLIEIAKCQSLASVPESVQWFQNEIAAATNPVPVAAPTQPACSDRSISSRRGAGYPREERDE